MDVQVLNLEEDPRREHFAYFCGMGYPYVGVTVPVDITGYRAALRERGEPFFLSFLYDVAQAANQVPQLRQRIRDGGIVEYSWCPTSHTVLRPDGVYGYCTLDADKPRGEFLSYARELHERAKESADIREDKEDSLPLLFLSSLPWFSYTALVQPAPSPADSNPRITWGKYSENGGRLTLPVSLLAHHGLVDGKHIGDFYTALERQLALLEA